MREETPSRPRKQHTTARQGRGLIGTRAGATRSQLPSDAAWLQPGHKLFVTRLTGCTLIFMDFLGEAPTPKRYLSEYPWYGLSWVSAGIYKHQPLGSHPVLVFEAEQLWLNLIRSKALVTAGKEDSLWYHVEVTGGWRRREEVLCVSESPVSGML